MPKTSKPRAAKRAKKPAPKRAPITPAGDAEPEVLGDGAPAAADPAQAARVSDANARVDRTLGEHVATAKAAGGRIPWPVDVGYSVMLLTPGYPPRRARIRNIHNHGTYALYDLVHENGGTIDGVGAERIGPDLEADARFEHVSMRLAALERHVEHGAAIAMRIADMEAVERKLADNLKKHREELEKVRLEQTAHARAEPGQTDIRDVVGHGEEPPKPSRKARKDSEPTPREDAFAGDEAEKDKATGIQTLEQLGVTLDQLQAAAFNRSTSSTGKPQQVKPVVVAGIAYLVTDSTNGIATLLPIADAEIWDDRWAEVYGEPRKLESQEPSAELAAGGALCGVPVKLGRAKAFIGPEEHALLVRLPDAKQLGDEPEARASGKEAAAGG